jgi:hypothetical protein
VPYLKDSNHHDFGHMIKKFHFAADGPEAQDVRVLKKEMDTRATLGIHDPLQAVAAHTEECECSHTVSQEAQTDQP